MAPVSAVKGGQTMEPALNKIARRSLWGLNAANFLQAEMVGVLVPVLNGFLKKSGWSYQALGITTAIGGLGALLFQAPAGWLTDKLTCRRALFAVAALLTGACLVAIPMIPRATAWIDTLLFLSGATGALFGPVLGALALALAGHRGLNRMMGMNQAWNHAGNIAAALVAMAVVSLAGLGSIFYSLGICSLLAAASMAAIRERDLDERVATGLTAGEPGEPSWRHLLHNRTVLYLFISIFLFHLANAPILPTVALYVKKLGGSDSLMTATVLTAQLVMVPVALCAGRLCDSWGAKAVMAVAFWVLPVRIFAYSLAGGPAAVVWLQGLDGIGAGIYGVAVATFSADLTRGKGGFNTLMGLFATSLAIGGVAGPALSGILVGGLGFRSAFYIFAAIAALGAVLFSWLVPNTARVRPSSTDFRKQPLSGPQIA
jgi:MFS family permease